MKQWEFDTSLWFIFTSQKSDRPKVSISVKDSNYITCWNEIGLKV